MTTIVKLADSPRLTSGADNGEGVLPTTDSCDAIVAGSEFTEEEGQS